MMWGRASMLLRRAACTFSTASRASTRTYATKIGPQGENIKMFQGEVSTQLNRASGNGIPPPLYAVIPLGLTIGVGYGYLDDENWRLEVIRLAMPLLRLLDPETAHSVVISLAKYGLVPHERRDPRKGALYEEVLHTKVWNKFFDNPVGLAAGFDKNAEAMESMLGVGFGFVEVGSITPEPQDGNARPRIFRIPEERAVINRIGCNSHGSKAVSERIKSFRNKTKRESGEGEGGVLGINIAKNKTSKDGAKDYVEACKRLADKADYIVINVSSPNTPGLRKLQAGKELSKILVHMKKTLNTYGPGVPLVVKIAPDLTDADKKEIASVALRHGVDGLIVSNTTISRPKSVLSRSSGNETGGLSGKPLCKLSTELIKEMYELTGGKIPIIGCGGVSTGADVYDKIKAGASLVQLYTALVYEGPALIPKLKRELRELLLSDGYVRVEDAVGVDTKVNQIPWYYFWKTKKKKVKRKSTKKPTTEVSRMVAVPGQ